MYTILFKFFDENETISMNASAKTQTKVIDVRTAEMQIAFPHFIFDTVNERSQFDFMANVRNYDRFTFNLFQSY